MSENIGAILAKNLDELMQENGFKPKDVARKTGLSDRMISYILKQERSAGIDVVSKLAIGLRVPIERLFRREPSQEYELTLLDKEHLDLIKNLTQEERNNVEQYAQFILERRKK